MVAVPEVFYLHRYQRLIKMISVTIAGEPPARSLDIKYEVSIHIYCLYLIINFKSVNIHR